ncbi:MAG TPA: M10 family metallopeptidase C-terminal domain-containing protein, partial [Allosphingosinicella sp.]
MTVVSDFTAILSGTSVHGSSGKGAFYTFSFLTSVQDYHASRYSAEALASFRPLFASEKAAARIALDAWASQSGLTFFEVPGGEGDIVFGVYDMALMGFGNFAGFAFYPGGRFDNPITSDIFLGSNAAGNMHLLLHEIGHAIGLKHPHEDDPTLEPALDDYSASVMSYKSGGHSGQTLGTLDLQAIHFLYGNAGADGGQVTSWSWDPDSFTLSQTGAAASETILGVGTTDIIVALGGDDFLQGRGGNDRLDGGAGDDQIYGGRGDDVLIGGPGSDDLTGNAGADRFVYTDAGDSTDIAEDGIFGFETGVDKIDLSALGPVTLAWTEGNYGSGGVYSDVVVTTRNGTMRIFVDGRVVQGDFIVATGPAGPIVGTGGDDVLQGTPEADVLRGEAGNDTLHGLGGDDLLDGGSGADRLVGGPGDDRYEIDHGGDLIVEDVGAGTDLAVSSVSYVLAPNVENLTLSGSAAIDATGNGLDNAIAGNEAANVLDGGGGADRMAGGGGNDVYHVDAGDVVVEAADAGTDAVRTALAAYALPANVEILIGTAASGQALTGNDLANELAGGAGNDLLDGAGGADQLAGGAGDDLYLVGTGDTVAEAADAGTDEVRTALAGYALGANVERLTGTAATGQSLTGNALDNAIAGGTGDDLLDGGGGADQLAGGAGSDVYLVDAGDSVTEGADAGTDEVRTALASYMLLENFERLTGTSAAGQTLVGNAADNRVTGGSGADAIDGGGGADELAGGAGDDVYLVDAGDTVVEAAAAGNDEVRTALAVFTLGANVEMLAGSSASGQALTGNALANRISGGAGNDVIDGGAGVDWLAGGLGDDSYFVDDPADYVSELAGVGYDRVYARVSVSLPTGMAIEMLAAADEAGTDPLVLAGNELDNRIVGNAGANTLHGLGGNDRLEGLGGDDMLVMTGADSDVALGGAGNDVYFLDSAGDTVLELAGEGTDEIRTALGAYSLAAIANVENLTGISASGQALSGNDDANRISGGSGNDVIDGRAGADAMHGGAGDDLYFADDGGDVVVELPGGGNDEVRASAASYALGENVETLVGTSNAGQVLSGNFQANVIRAGAGDDTIYAGGGNDALHGGAGRDGIYAGAGDDLIDGGAGPDYMVGQAGDDLYLVDDAGDEALEAANEGLDEVRTAISFALGAHVENLTGTGSSGQILTGNGGDN